MCKPKRKRKKKLKRDSSGFKEERNKLNLECTDDFDIQGSLLGEIKRKELKVKVHKVK